MEMQVEVNGNVVKDNDPIKLPGGVVALVTPPLDGNFWIARVPVKDDQAVVAFPKFGQIGIGFQYEDVDWNRNLPATVKSGEIFDHIKANARGARKMDCIRAIRLLQRWVRAMKGASNA